MPKDKVMAFVDYENIRIGLAKNYVEHVTPAQIIKAIEILAKDRGEFRRGTFFGDWTKRPEDARDIEDRGWRAHNVLATRGGKDRSDIPMALEIYDAFQNKKEITTFIIAFGDAGFKEIIIKGRENGKHTLVCAVGLEAARELITMAEGFFPIEVLLNLTPKLPATLPGMEPSKGFRDWRPLVRRLDSLEKVLPYVVKNYFRDTILDASFGCGETQEDKETFLGNASDEGVIETKDIPNPKVPGRTVTIIKLNRQNTLVKSILLQK